MFECDQLQFSEALVVHTAIEPSTPRDLEQTTSLRYRDALIFSWRAPLSDGGSKLQQYTLQIDSQDYTQTHVISVQASSFKFDSLNPATSYSVKIKVNNLVGESEWSDLVVATTGIESSRPGIISFDASTRTTLSLSWSKLEGANTGGSDSNPLQIIYYHLHVSDSDSETIHQITGDQSTFVVTSLQAGKEYKFRMKAENDLHLMS
jgi:hypothetical protein